MTVLLDIEGIVDKKGNTGMQENNRLRKDNERLRRRVAQLEKDNSSKQKEIEALKLKLKVGS